MKTSRRQTPPIKVSPWFFPVVVTLIMWNVLGIVAFLQQILLSPPQISALPANEQALYANTPLWVNIAFACAVFSGTLGSIILLLQKSLAVPLLWISLFGVMAQMYHAFFIVNAFDVYGSGRAILPMLVILVAIYLVWLSQSALNRRWLN